MRREKPCLLCGQEPEEKKHCTCTVIIGEEAFDLCLSCYTHLMLVRQNRAKPNNRERRLLGSAKIPIDKGNQNIRPIDHYPVSFCDGRLRVDAHQFLRNNDSII